MTIKQLIVGTLVGSTIVGIMVHRVHNATNLQAVPAASPAPKLANHKMHSHKIASLKRSPWFKKHHKASDSGTAPAELSSRKLYGE